MSLYTGNDRFRGNDRYSGLQGPDRFFRYIRRLLYYFNQTQLHCWDIKVERA